MTTGTAAEAAQEPDKPYLAACPIAPVIPARDQASLKACQLGSERAMVTPHQFQDT